MRRNVRVLADPPGLDVGGQSVGVPKAWRQADVFGSELLALCVIGTSGPCAVNWATGARI